MGNIAEPRARSSKRHQSDGGLFGIQFDLRPMDDLLQRVRSMAGDDFLMREMEKNIMPDVLDFLVEQVEVHTPVLKGNLKEAISKKMIFYATSNVLVGLVGVDHKFMKEIERRSQTDREEKFRRRRLRIRHDKKLFDHEISAKMRAFRKGTRYVWENRGHWMQKISDERIRGEMYRTKIRPSKYFHLVEFGHATRSGGHVAGRQFFQTTINANWDRVQEMIREGLEIALNQWLATSH